MLYFPRNRSITRYFSFTSFQLRTENFAATPPAFAALQLLVLFSFFAVRLPVGASLGTRDVSSCQLSFLPSLSFHQALHLSPFQTVAGCYFAICLPLIMSLSYNFNQLLHLCVLPCHTEILLSQFLFYDRRPLFSFVRCLGNCPNGTGGNFRFPLQRQMQPMATCIYANALAAS